MENLEIQQSNEKSEEFEPFESKIEPNNNQKQQLKTSNGYFLIALVFVFIYLTNFYVFSIFFKPIKVVGTSMQPTINTSVLNDDDTTRCDIVYYRESDSYSRGDIVILENNNQKYVPEEEIQYLIKRVIATSGDIIKFSPYTKTLESDKVYYSVEVTDKNGNIVISDEDYINGEMFYYSRGEGSEYNYYYYAVEYDTFREIFYNLVNNRSTSFVIPENQYFVMGDNRNNSTDSRIFGAVDEDDIAGFVAIQVDYGETLFGAIFEKIFN